MNKIEQLEKQIKELKAKLEARDIFIREQNEKISSNNALIAEWETGLEGAQQITSQQLIEIQTQKVALTQAEAKIKELEKEKRGRSAFLTETQTEKQIKELKGEERQIERKWKDEYDSLYEDYWKEKLDLQKINEELEEEAKKYRLKINNLERQKNIEAVEVENSQLQKLRENNDLQIQNQAKRIKQLLDEKEQLQFDLATEKAALEASNQKYGIFNRRKRKEEQNKQNKIGRASCRERV